MKHWVLLLVFAATATGALAQLRTIPGDAKRGNIRHVQGMVVEIDGAARELAPAAQIRGPSNLIVVPAAVPEGALVKYIANEDGRILRVWILTPQEAAQLDR